MTTRSIRAALGLLLPFALVAAACGDDDGAADTGGSPSPAVDDAPAVTIGAQDFGESRILAEIYAQALEAEGFDVTIQSLAGFRPIELEAFDAGDINLAPEYAASMLEYLNEDETQATSDPVETTELLNEHLADIGLVALTPSDAVDTNAFVVTQETADELGITAISDLADHPDLVLGAPADCETNPFCIPGLERVYGIDLSDTYTALEPGAIGDALDAGAIDIGLLFSTDARIAENDWVLLEDDESMLAADNVVPVLTDELADVEALVDVLNEVSATLTTAELTELNRRYEIDVEDPEDIARSYLEAEGLL